MKLIYKGEIQIKDGPFGHGEGLYLNGELLAERVLDDLPNESTIKVRYFISVYPFESLENVEERFIQTVTGTMKAESRVLSGSEWTGPYGYDEDLTVGGHNLIEELTCHVGNFALVEIEKA